MWGTEVKLPEVTQLIRGRASIGGPSDPKLLHLTVNSLFLKILFSFRSLFSKCDRCSHEITEKLPNHFSLFSIKCVFMISQNWDFTCFSGF